MKIGEKKLSLSSLDKKLWKIFSEYIRLRDADEYGMVRCISCGKRIPYKGGEAQCGHYYPRVKVYEAIKYDEKNNNAQCVHCNHYLEGNAQGYREGLIKKYGCDVLEYLDTRKKADCKHDRMWYTVAIDEYTHKLKQLKKQRGI